ncbi:MAG: DNA-protecting protein DprA [Parcubacteria group bacterium]|nr:DNA-protecting protein DprA [Parcubacteria group bacterium]
MLPPLLNEIPNPPKKLYLKGEWPDFKLPWIAVVGTRKATAEGLRIARAMARELAEHGAVIVSGLAFGIDTAAHQGALDAGGKTVAVLANGLDRIYPAQNEKLAKNIERNGAIVSEYPENTPSLPYQFLERNRIISGLVAAVVVVEAPERSGALATAGYAASQGREVFVVPGPINHPNYRGSHRLIRDGARLTTSAKEILEDLGFMALYEEKRQEETAQLQLGENAEQKFIAQSIKDAGRPLAIDEIAYITKLEPHVLNREIAFLIIRGVIKETEKGYIL